MRTLLKLCASACLLLGMNGCATRSAVVIDSESDWLMIDAPSRVSVSTTKDGETWQHVGKVVVPPGMMIGPGPKP